MNRTGTMESFDIKHFVRERLGCGCPDEVFSSIRVTHKPGSFDGLPVDYLVEIGNRLLIAVIAQQDWHNINSAIEQIIHVGKQYRDLHGFNRFRFVIATTDDEAMTSIQPVFDSLTGLDEKIHLHFIEPAALPEFMNVHTD